MKRRTIILLLAFLMGCVPALTEQATTAEQTAEQKTAEVSKTEISADTEQALSVWQPWADIPLSNEMQEYIYTLCEEYNLAYSFIIALIDTESNFKTDVVSATDDYGLMQINACNHREGFDYLDPYDNVTMGIEMLSDLAEKYDDVESVLMAYNFGEAGAKKLWKQGIYSTDYTKKVLDKKLKYEKEQGVNL